MNKNKWFLNGGRGSGRSFRLLCETYKNKIANLQHTVDTQQGYLDHDIEYDMDKTIQEQKIKIAELEKENAELKAFRQDCVKLTEDNVVIVRQRAETSKQLTKATELLRKLVLEVKGYEEIYGYDTCEPVQEAEQFLNSEVEND